MIPEQHHAGEQTQSCTRRAFLERTIALGFVGISASAFLTECGPSSANSSSTHSSSEQGAILTWYSEDDQFGINHALASHFSTINDQGIIVNHASNQQQRDLFNRLKEGNASPDVLSLDVIWKDEFVNSNVIVPLTGYWNRDMRGVSFLPITMQSAMDDSRDIWTAPFRSDVGLLYYRTDMIASPPETWDDLVEMAAKAMVDYHVLYGYLWEGTGEGLVCNFVEVLSSYGGTILDKNNPERVVIGSDSRNAALQALNQMLRWIDTSISPRNITAYAEDDARSAWVAGKSAFMRNWPFAIAMSNDATQSQIAGRFAVTPLPSATFATRSCIGGWQLAINKNSRNQEAAWTFIKWMLGQDVQQYVGRMASFAVARQEMYASPYNQYIAERNPFFGEFESIMLHGQLRPRSSHYDELSQTLQTYLGLVLQGKMAPEEAIDKMQTELQSSINNKSSAR
jgi:multiple sugar transport system substrate-binding protein